jgi:hypothetical protein
MIAFPAAVFLLCFATSLVCLVLLVRAYLRTRSRLLFWSAVCFVFLAFNNGLLFLDLVVIEDMDLLVPRQITALLAIATLLYGFIWDME